MPAPGSGELTRAFAACSSSGPSSCCGSPARSKKLSSSGPQRGQEADPAAGQAARHEPEHPGTGPVQPRQIIDDHQHRAGGGRLAQHREGRGGHQQPSRRRPLPVTEGDVQRVPGARRRAARTGRTLEAAPGAARNRSDRPRTPPRPRAAPGCRSPRPHRPPRPAGPSSRRPAPPRAANAPPSAAACSRNLARISSSRSRPISAVARYVIEATPPYSPLAARRRRLHTTMLTPLAGCEKQATRLRLLLRHALRTPRMPTCHSQG